MAVLPYPGMDGSIVHHVLALFKKNRRQVKGLHERCIPGTTWCTDFFHQDLDFSQPVPYENSRLVYSFHAKEHAYGQ
jgi:hypothetical protein